MEFVHDMRELTAVARPSRADEARQGGLPAFELLYRENAGRVYALCLRLAGDARKAEELTQDVFVRAWEKLDSFRGESAFSTWLHRLALNVVLGQYRAEKRRTSRVISASDVVLADAESGEMSDAGTGMDLEAAIAALPESTRIVFVLHDVEGYTHREIADLTGRAEGTCKALLHRARIALRKRLK